MPVYLYECKNCHARIEKLRPMDAMDDVVTCPSCKVKCRRIIAKPGHFQRGPGWHARIADTSPTKPGEV